MPTDAERLTIRSNKPTVDAAVSSCISQLMRERPEMESDQAQAICLSQARKATGK